MALDRRSMKPSRNQLLARKQGACLYKFRTSYLSISLVQSYQLVLALLDRSRIQTMKKLSIWQRILQLGLESCKVAWTYLQMLLIRKD